MLQKYTESDIELRLLDSSRVGFLRKFVNTKSPYVLNFKFLYSLCFMFSNVVNIDAFLIHRFLLVFWIFTGCKGSVINLKINLRLGVHYHHFYVYYGIEERKFYYMLSFVIDNFLPQQNWSGCKIVNNTYMFFFNNLEILTNYKLARGVYFHRIQQKLFVQIKAVEKELMKYFNIYLTSLKINVI